MTRDELAAKLHGREYGKEITKDEAAEAERSRLVVIFGASDDLCELRGAIDDELDARDGTLILIDEGGSLLREIEDNDAEILKKYLTLEAVRRRIDHALRIKVRWCKTPEWAWTYETDAEHSTFDIMEDGEGFCRGIVIDLREVFE